MHSILQSRVFSFVRAILSILIWGILICPVALGQQVQCVVPGDYYQEPTQGLSAVNMGLVMITQAESAAGGPVPLNVTYCSGDQELGVEVPWSGASAVR
ncbi:MAG: hypothetical protein KC917_16365, partial [Candidatus Omnitrophica bacterium]|nr:hypothetical protein [Candidatus Omnitrophota bacterium]